jgi:hypothetical protein
LADFLAVFLTALSSTWDSVSTRLASVLEHRGQHYRLHGVGALLAVVVLDVVRGHVCSFLVRGRWTAGELVAYRPAGGVTR